MKEAKAVRAGDTQSRAAKQDEAKPHSDSVEQVPAPPQGWDRIKWLGPGFLWMVSAAGSGELLFTPRVAALYGYTLLWAMIAAVVLKWFINREIGRFTVCTGASILDGFKQLPGPRNWAIWLILLPQAVVAVASIAGLAGAAATALTLALPGALWIWTVGALLVAAGLVLWGRYTYVERAATVLALVLAIAAIAAAVSVFPDVGALTAGLAPVVPEQVDYGEILPWLGFMLSGAAGLMWYSFWLNAKGYGASALVQSRQNDDPAKRQIDPSDLDARQREHLRGWITQMTLDNTIAVVGTLIVTLAFLILGAELLRPRNLVPEENRVAEVLGQLLGEVWGPIGFWFMIAAVFVGFWDTVLSNQDGFGRLFAGGTRILDHQWGLRGRWTDEHFLKNVYVAILATALPIGLYLLFGEPVGLLKLAGAIEAAHIPVVTGLTLYLNHRLLPEDLRPSWFVFAATTLAGLFFVVFAVIYMYQLIGGASGG